MYTSNFNNVLDRMLSLSRAFEESADRTPATAVADSRVRRQLWLPAVDIYETETAFVVEADLPGTHRENVDIQFDRNTLTISGTRAATLPSKEKAQQLRVFSAERLSGGFSRSVRLPDHVDSEHIQATFVDGVLAVTVPKSAGALSRKIPISAGGEQRQVAG